MAVIDTDIGPITVPDEWTDEQIAEYMQAEEDRANPTRGMGTGQLFAAGMGQAVDSTIRGAKSLIGMDVPDAQEQAALDAPLLDTTAGMAGNIAGHGLQMAALPGSTMPKAAMSAAGYTALQPDTDATDVALAATGGAIGQKVGALATRGMQTVLPKARQALVKAADRVGMKVTPGMRSGRKSDLIREAQWARDPATADMMGEVFEHNQKKLNEIATRAMGIEPVDYIDDSVMDAAEAAISSKYNDVLQQIGGEIELSPAYRGIRDAASKYVSVPGLPDKAAVRRLVDEIIDAGPRITPQQYMTWHKSWRDLVHKAYKAGDHNTARVFEGAVNALDTAVERSVGEGVKETFKAARQAARAKILVDSALDSQSGNIGAKRLANAMKKSKFRQSNRKGNLNSDLVDMYDGARFIMTNVPDSGTTQGMGSYMRQITAGGTGLGAGGGAFMATGDPITSAAIGDLATLAPGTANKAAASMALNPAALAAQRLGAQLPTLPAGNPLMRPMTAPLVPMLGRASGAMAAAPALIGQPQ